MSQKEIPPIYNLERNTQANLLAEALLREFMHKRKFLETLKEFDVENPRNEMTVSSRAVMQDLMLMKKLMPEMKSQGIESIVEAVCSHRIQKKEHLENVSEMQQEIFKVQQEQQELEEEFKKKLEELQLAEQAVEEEKVTSEKTIKLAKKTTKKKLQQQKGEEGSNNSAAAASSSSSGTTTTTTKKKTTTQQNKKHHHHGETKTTSHHNKKEKHTQQQQQQDVGMSLDELLETNEQHLQIAARRSSIHQTTAAAAASKSVSSEREEGDESLATSINTNTDMDKNTRANSGVLSIASRENSDERRFSGIGGDDVESEEGDSYDNSSQEDQDQDQQQDEEDDYEAGLRRIREEGEQKIHSSGVNLMVAAGVGGSSVHRRDSWSMKEANNNSSSNHHSTNNNNDKEEQENSPHSHSQHQDQEEKEDSQQQEDFTPDPKTMIGTQLATELIHLLVGSVGSYKKIPPSFFQPILFTRYTKRNYGLVQKSGGPCGAIAALQARLLSQWFHHSNSSSSNQNPQIALRAGLFNIFCDILASNTKSNGTAIILTPQTSSSSSSSSKFVEFFSSINSSESQQKQIQLFSFLNIIKKDQQELSSILLHSSSSGKQHQEDFVQSWETSKLGLLCFILSMILTRCYNSNSQNNNNFDLERGIISEMDEARPLIVEHGYCSQEMVNLLLSGNASSHVHDGIIGVGEDHHVKLKGLTVPSNHNNNTNTNQTNKLDVGFLSMMEVRKLLAVGSLGKHPSVPVWVIYNESHFTVLFSKNRNYQLDPEAEKQAADDEVSFDLTYYDPQCDDEEYRLTVKLSNLPLPAHRADALVSYVDQIIRTRCEGWKNARVNWNGADPLL